MIPGIETAPAQPLCRALSIDSDSSCCDQAILTRSDPFSRRFALAVRLSWLLGLLQSGLLPYRLHEIRCATIPQAS